jgi:chemotaxis protein CheX
MLQAEGVPQLTCAEDFLSLENLERADEVVAEIFAVMFGLEIHPVHIDALDGNLPESDEITAIVGFSGAMRGCCRIQVSSLAAKSIASAMLGGLPIEEDDDSIHDALGELCNMLAGGWKNSIPSLCSECALSPPTVISGNDYKVHIRKPVVQLARTYKFDVHVLHLVLHCQTPDFSDA